ncbi:MAG TPA: hypothetical protein VGE41_13850, partial [Verrucomicrobiae bacterium]
MHYLKFVVFLLVSSISAISCLAAKVVLVAGGDDSNATRAMEVKLNGPFGAGFDAKGNMFFCEMPGNMLRKMNPAGVVSITAGNGTKGDTGDNGPAGQALLNGPHNLAVLKSGDVLIADTWNNRIRKIDARTGKIAAIIGTGKKGFSGDGGPANRAEFGGLYCATLDPEEQNLYLADLDNRRIRVVDMKTGIVRTVAGNGAAGLPADDADALASPLLDPRAVAADAQGNVYILERNGNALRVVDS